MALTRRAPGEVGGAYLDHLRGLYPPVSDVASRCQILTCRICGRSFFIPPHEYAGRWDKDHDAYRFAGRGWPGPPDNSVYPHNFAAFSVAWQAEGEHFPRLVWFPFD